MIFGSFLKGLYLNPKYAKKVKKDVENNNKQPSSNIKNQDDESFGTSLLVSAATNSVIPGLIVGGSLAGALVGSSMASNSSSRVEHSSNDNNTVDTSNDSYDYDSGTPDFDWD